MATLKQSSNILLTHKYTQHMQLHAYRN